MMRTSNETVAVLCWIMIMTGRGLSMFIIVIWQLNRQVCACSATRASPVSFLHHILLIRIFRCSFSSADIAIVRRVETPCLFLHETKAFGSNKQPELKDSTFVFSFVKKSVNILLGANFSTWWTDSVVATAEVEKDRYQQFSFAKQPNTNGQEVRHVYSGKTFSFFVVKASISHQ